MFQLMTKFEVEDFAKWKAGFLANENLRVAAGSTGWHFFQEPDNPKMIIVITYWDKIEKAKEFSQSQALIEAQRKAGVLTKPEVYLLQPF